MLGNKSGRKYHSFYFLMHHANFFKTNMLNPHAKLVVLCFFFFFANLLFKEENVIFQFKCFEYEVAKYSVFFKLLSGLFFLFVKMFERKKTVSVLNMKLCNKILIPVRNEILRFSFPFFILISMFGHKTGRKYYSFYFLMHHVNFF